MTVGDRRPRSRLDFLDKHVDGRRFASTVVPEQDQDLILEQGQSQLVHSCLRSEFLREVVDFQRVARFVSADILHVPIDHH